MAIKHEQLDESEIDKIIESHLERCTAKRYPYQVTQKLAPIRHGIAGRLREVECSEISVGGISFYLSYPPDFDHFAMSLNNDGEPIQVIGKVIGHEQIKGMAVFLVRSEFKKRLEASSSPK